MSANKAVAKAVSREGKNKYTQTYLRYKAGEGYSDCSSLMYWAYKEAYGINIGEWTGAQVEHGYRVAFYGGKSNLTRADLKQLQPGDLIFFGGGDAVHVEMYVGNNRLFGHGCGTPSYKNALTYQHSAGFYQARRYYDEKLPVDDNDELTAAIVIPKLPELKRYSCGNYVMLLQSFLNVYGFNIAVDGDFGPITNDAVENFQALHSLEQDGIVGPFTWGALFDNVLRK